MPPPTPADPAPTPEEPPAPEEPAQPAQPSQAGTGEDQSDLECEADEVTCPMFDWMEENTVPAVENRNLPELAKALHKIEFMAPDPSWNEGDEGWARISRDGATKAEAGDFRGARAACKACHQSWRDRFRQEGRRTAPMPELPDNAEQGLPNL